MALLRDKASELSLDGLRISRPPLNEEDATLRLLLRQDVLEFITVDDLRERGWSNPEGDLYFKNKHENADRHIRDGDQEMVYYRLYLGIAEELQEATSVFTVNGSTSGELRGLNLCMAPGGYTRFLLEQNPQMAVSGITLSEAQNGHPVMAEVAENPQVDIQYLDINLLATSMGVPASEIPADHPDVTKFLTNDPFADLKFDVVIADGAVLRTHERGEHRLDKEREALRLRLSQLILSFARIKEGGTFMLLLHRIDSWDNFVLLRSFEQFSDIKVHKPTKRHVQSSSFYLVAKNVRISCQAAIDALNEWKASWRQATFGGEEGKGELPKGPGSIFVKTAFQDYGAKLIELGRPVWRTQAGALEKASYVKPYDGGTSSARHTATKNTAASSNNWASARNKAPEPSKRSLILEAPTWRNGPQPSKETAAPTRRSGPHLTSERVGQSWRVSTRPSNDSKGQIDNPGQTPQADDGASKSETSASQNEPSAMSPKAGLW